jgi:hypothetical protein
VSTPEVRAHYYKVFMDHQIGDQELMTCTCDIFVKWSHSHLIDMLEDAGLLTLPTAGITMKTQVEWGIMMSADDPADREVGTGWESEEAARAEIQRIRDLIYRMDTYYKAEDYEPMHVVRRYVTLPKYTPWEIVP